MKKIVLFVSVMLCAASAFAQPLTLEQASPVVTKGQMEVGIENLTYGVDHTEITDTTVKFDQTAMVVPVSARYGITDNIEASLALPYQSLTYKQEVGGVNITDLSDSKMADAILTGKMSFGKISNMDMSASLGLTLPTGSASDKFTTEFKKGMNITPAVQVGYDLCCFRIDANLGYSMTGEYDANTTPKIKVNPGDILSAGVGAEKDCPKIAGMTWIAEFLYNNISDASIAGVSQSGTGGSQMDVALGARYKKGSIKTKLGVALSLGDEKYRDHDWKVIAGATYLFKI